MEGKGRRIEGIGRERDKQRRKRMERREGKIHTDRGRRMEGREGKRPKEREMKVGKKWRGEKERDQRRGR